MNLPREEDKARFLATLEIARRELILLEYSYARLFSGTIDAGWARQLTEHMAVAETLEAFVSRFGRFQDTVGDKLIPRTLVVLLERPRGLIDNLARAEQLGWIADAEAWITARELRNRLVHEYMTDPDRFAGDIRAAGEFMGMFRRNYAAFLAVAQERFGVGEQQLQTYLGRKNAG
ncbi:MAG: hypothetical protein BECKG1743D_GA0114223_102995 [Candidatus Kentron sp. G]|nr:MAG: hypothetical protein BECKG1743F_GA0114225_102735 [Candidatus Kentron sp. G]VFM99963.1 MAG: hypothetical protein BECKG1743E_GA0114224_102945 [Candidatus Kentron sp. G]VFN01660.1 MAG: hypothetical protein BECKG1743D_GA0114223_102995 [Candidatus Kentron sp. G]